MNDTVLLRSRRNAAPIERELHDATISVLREHGWSGLTLERVAASAGRARSTLWRQGITRGSLMTAVTRELAADFQASMYPVLTSPGSGRARLLRSLDALCDVLDRHLALMLATDEAFHQETEPGQPPDYLHPFIQFLHEGQADGSLAPGDDVVRTADVVFNAIVWPYAHLRGRHQWTSERARTAIVGLVLNGVVRHADTEE